MKLRICLIPVSPHTFQLPWRKQEAAGKRHQARDGKRLGGPLSRSSSCLSHECLTASARSVGTEAVARLAAMPSCTPPAHHGAGSCLLHNCCAHACIRSAVTADTTACSGA
eukprot:5675509-Pleurochrysis_carterae.AAC.3